ncbi:MAG TPA: DUF4374 domain-containing protein [Polyangia bacterium]
MDRETLASFGRRWRPMMAPLGALALVAAMAAGCDDDDLPPAPRPSDAGADTAVPDAVVADAGDAGAPEVRSAGPYLGSSTFTMPGNMWSSYTAVVPTVSDTTDENLRKGIETIGYIAPSSYKGAVFVPGGANPVITKYLSDDQGRLTKAGTVSFAGLGVTTVNTGPTIGRDMITPDKAYYFDGANYRIIVWNPTTMELTGRTIDLKPLVHAPIADKPDFRPSIMGSWARQRGDRMFVAVRWGNFSSNPASFVTSAGLLIIDTATDTAVRLLQDERLADSIYTVMTDSSDLYLFTGAYGVSVNHTHKTTRPGGALRVRAGEETFDPTYYLNLDVAVGNRPASTPVYAGGTSVYLKAFHEEKQPITAEIMAAPNTLIAKEAWRYWKVDLESKVAPQEMTEIPWTSTDGFFYEIPEEKRLFIGVMTADKASTTLYEATPAGFIKTITVAGVLQVLSPLHRGR